MRPRRDSGFTVTEVLVVIGIIVLLVAILLPTIATARKSARKAQIGLTLQSISTALEAYRTDHGDYPRLPPEGYPPSQTPRSGEAYNVYGAQLLAWALLAPAPDRPTGDTQYDGDGADGFGFRIRRPAGQVQSTSAVGKVFGPYLDPDKFRLRNKERTGAPIPNANEWMILDPFEHVILYYPAHPKPQQTDVNATHGYVWEYAGVAQALRLLPMWNATHNLMETTDLTRPYGVSLAQLQARLGALPDGKFDPTQRKEPERGPYLLWSAGPDGKFGAPNESAGADDVTNLQP